MAILTINSREARAKFRDLLDRLLAKETDIIIERNGKPICAMIPIEDYEELLDELDEMRAARRAAALYENWMEDPATGQPIENIEARLKARGVLDE